MDNVTVFVDDPVLGRLPSVCVRHGDPTIEAVGAPSFGTLWLLILLGPVGWIAAFILSTTTSARGERLTVRLPLCEDAFRRNRIAPRLRSFASVATIVLAIATFAMAVNASSFLWIFATELLGVATVLAAAEWHHERQVCREPSVGVSIDVSRRWVTLKGVHPKFKASVQPMTYDDATLGLPT